MVGDLIVKQYRLRSASQEAVLDAFEEEGWPCRIYDPLPPRGDACPKQRLHWTINRLNGHQENHLVRFFGDGTGEMVCWEPTQGVLSSAPLMPTGKKQRMAA